MDQVWEWSRRAELWEQCQDRLEVEHICGKGKYRQKAFYEELVWIDLPSSIPIPIQEDGGSDVLETQLLPCWAWGRRDGDPTLATLQAAAWGLGVLPGPFVFLAREVRGGRVMRNPILFSSLSHIPAPSCTCTLPSP